MACLTAISSENDHIAQQCTAGFLIGVIVPVLSQREREHVGGTVFLPIDPVQSADLCIADEGDTDFCVLPEMFCHQNRLTAATNEHTDSHRHRTSV